MPGESSIGLGPGRYESISRDFGAILYGSIVGVWPISPAFSQSLIAPGAGLAVDKEPSLLLSSSSSLVVWGLLPLTWCSSGGGFSGRGIRARGVGGKGIGIRFGGFVVVDVRVLEDDAAGVDPD